MLELPVKAFGPDIVESVTYNLVTILTASAGSGKSTLVPWYLQEAGLDPLVAQPTLPAVYNTAARIANERRQELGGVIGYHTGEQRLSSDLTRLLFCTDGLALIRELYRSSRRGVLVIDEAHLWNLNQEVLVAWAKLNKIKLLLMSATLDAKGLSEYLGGAPIVNVPGTMYPVKELPPGRSRAEDADRLVRQGLEVLVFADGLADIKNVITDLKILGTPAEILPLYGDLKREEQAKCFLRYDRPRLVVATDVAETSLTPDVDAVVDNGEHKRPEVVDGVEGIYTRTISLANREQRKRRAGRTKNGVYIDHCKVPLSERDQFATPEIQRLRLDQTVLRLAQFGFDMEELEFFHQPDRTQIQQAKVSLRGLGCMGESIQVTAKGRRVARKGTAVEIACMVVEAEDIEQREAADLQVDPEKLGLVNDVLDAAAVLSVGGILSNKCDRHSLGELHDPDSDVLTQANVFRSIQGLGLNDEQLQAKGINPRSYLRAARQRKTLARSAHRREHWGSRGNRQDLLRCISAGMVDNLYHRNWGTEYKNSENDVRELDKFSMVSRYPSARWVVAQPFNKEITDKRSGERITLRVLRMVTKVDPIWLAEVAPHLVRKETGLNPQFDSEQDTCVSTTKTFFKDQLIDEDEQQSDPEHPEAAARFADWVASKVLQP